MVQVGVVGWRGLVGSVLLTRMQEEEDFRRAEFNFFSSSSPGKEAPSLPGVKPHPLKDAHSIDSLKAMDLIISCQGSDYTRKVFETLRMTGWKGYWLDAASYLRLDKEACLILDPLNKKSILEALEEGQKNFIGANCTVSLMMLALQGLFEEELIEWVHTASYQAISGSGSQAIEKLFEDLEILSQTSSTDSHRHPLLGKMHQAGELLKEKSKFSKEPRLGVNLFPWIDSPVEGGQTREEAKGASETNKILNSTQEIPIDGTCVRVPVLRCHSQTLTLSLKKALTAQEMEEKIQRANPWVRVIPNIQKDTLEKLTPSLASENLDILVGRVRRLHLPGNLYEVFTVGDQLLWGASEPLRRCFNLILDFLEKSR